MARNLRSSSHARSNNSRPSTPVPNTANMPSSSSFTDSARPRKQRRTGRTSRVGTDPLQDTPVSTQSQPEQLRDTSTKGVNGTRSVEANGDWDEPQLRAPVPSYDDTPWSAVSSSANPVLGTMRPLGSMPSAADLRKVGLVPSKPGTPNIPAMKEPQPAPNEKKDDSSRTPLTPEEEPLPEPTPNKPTIEEDLAAFAILPVPNSADADIETVKAAVESALRLASDANNRPVTKGLLRLWEKCGSDPYALSVLDAVCQETPTSPQRSMFQSVMRGAWSELDSQNAADDSTAPRLTRARSASSVSSLSSAKSLEPETFAPAPVVSATPTTRIRKGKQAKNTAQKKKALERRSAISAADLQRQRASENPELSTEAVQAKKSRLRRSLPKIVAPESGIRSSLASRPPSHLASPGPATSAGEDNTEARRGRSESVASSDAGDNRRLTPSLTDDEPSENLDICRNCEGNGQLLCCDGCVFSFHFSCLDPPLDPANPPNGDWFCPKCSIQKSLNTLRGGIDKVSEQNFALPSRIRDFFAGVRTNEDGKYEETAALPRINPRAARGSRSGRYDDPFLLRTIDAKGKLIFCTKCGRTTNGRRPIIQCDYCSCAFHMDCLDPPMAVPPTQRAGSDRLYHTWMCPNHAYHDMQIPVTDEEGYETMKRIRRPKNPRFVDIEILPEAEEDENLEDEEKEGVTYRVSEKGVKLDFIQRVKAENENNAAKRRAAAKYFEYAKTHLDGLSSEAHAFYASQKPIIPEEDTTAAILNSRTVAEREAAANLISFAGNHQVTWRDEDNGNISLLIDQLKANAPNNEPPPQDEIASLRALQRLIEQRISVLKPQTAAQRSTAESTAQPPQAQAQQPTSIEEPAGSAQPETMITSTP